MIRELVFVLVGGLLGGTVLDLWPWDMMGRLKPGRKGSIFSGPARTQHPRFWRLGWRARARARVAAEEERLRQEVEGEERED